MIYLLTFFEGVLAFLSPCVLPLIPVFVSYFAAGAPGEKQRTRKNALGFVIGLAVVFVAMGAFVGVLGVHLSGRPLEIAAGVLLILFGLHYMRILRLPCIGRSRDFGLSPERLQTLTFPWSIAFGAAFALCWAPCVGPFLGAALMKAAMSGSLPEGMFLLLLFALGMGFPFFLSALLLDKLKWAFATINRHYKVINRVCGILLLGMGLLMVSGLFGELLH